MERRINSIPGYVILLFWFMVSTGNSVPLDSLSSGDEIIIEMTNGDEDSAVLEEITSREIEQMPQLIEFVKANYPADLIKKGIAGTVLLELLVNETGHVDSAGVVTGVHPVLDSNAVVAAKSFKFTPALIGGDSVTVLLQYEYRFTLDNAVDPIVPVVNMAGVFLERGTRFPIQDAMIVVRFLDSADNTLPLPFSHHIDRIGAIPGQHLEENNLVTSTDSLGQFSFYSLPSCSVEVQMIAPGYEQFKSRELITAGDIVNVKYYVQRITYSDYEIVVYGKAEEKEVSRRQLSIQEIRMIPGLGGDAVKVVQAMPGVARPAFGSGEVVVRGSPSWDSRYFLDGVQLPMLYHFGGLKSVYNSEALKSVDFYPGGFGTRYGGAVAGAIEIHGKRAADDRLRLQLDVSTIDGFFLVEGPINKKVSVLASARRSFAGDIIGWYIKKNPDRFMMTMSPFYWDYLVRTDIKLSKNNNVFVTLFGSRDSLSVISSMITGGSEEISTARDRIGHKETFNMGIVGWDLEINDKLKNNLRYALNYHTQKMNIMGYVKIDQDAIVNTLRDQFSAKFNDKITLNIGADVEVTNLNLILEMLEGNIVRRDTSSNWVFGVMGGYANFEIQPFENLQIIPGLRYDYYPELDYEGSVVPELWDYKKYDDINSISGEPSLRLTSRWKFTDKQTLKASVGNYSQTPQPIGQVIHQTWGEPNMPATKAAHYVAGHEWHITDLINSDVQFYLNRQWNIPVMAGSSQLTNGSDDQKKWSKNGLGRMWGMEVMLRHLKGERFFGWVAYTLSRSERYNHSTKKWELFGNDETHNLQVLGSWHLKKEWDVGFRTRFVSGKPTTPIVGVIESENGNYFEPQYGKTNSERVNPFFQIDLRVDKKFVFEKWMYSFYVDFQNVSWFLYKSPEMEDFNYDYSEKTTIAMPPIVGVGWKAEF